MRLLPLILAVTTLLTLQGTNASPLPFRQRPERAAPLPAPTPTFAGFAATKTSDHNVLLAWTSENEGSKDHFVIEKSPNGKNWKTIAIAFAGTGEQDNTYEYVDRNVGAAPAFYRIRLQGADGLRLYSDVKTVKEEIRVAAGILQDGSAISIRLYGKPGAPLTVSLLNPSGQTLLQKSYDHPETAPSPDAIIRFSTAGQAPGHYTLVIRDAVGSIESRAVVIR